MCFQAEENVKDLFSKCIISKKIRDHICDVLHSQQKQIIPRYREGDLQLILDKRENLQCIKLKTITCFVIGCEWCNKILREQKKNNIALVREILEE
jgi:hypothetical protein